MIASEISMNLSIEPSYSLARLCAYEPSIVQQWSI